MDPDQTAQEQSDLGLHCLLDRRLKHFSRRQKQTTFVVIGVLRINTCALSPSYLYSHVNSLSSNLCSTSLIPLVGWANIGFRGIPGQETIDNLLVIYIHK